MGFSDTEEIYHALFISSNLQYVIKYNFNGKNGERLLLALVRQFCKYGLHHRLELPQNFFNLKIIYSTLQVQNYSADYQYSDGPHGCEVHSEVTTHSVVLSQYICE